MVNIALRTVFWQNKCLPEKYSFPYRPYRRYRSRFIDKDKEIRSKMIKRASRYGRYEYKRIPALHSKDSPFVKHSKIRRVCRQEDLKVPSKHPKK